MSLSRKTKMMRTQINLWERWGLFFQRILLSSPPSSSMLSSGRKGRKVMKAKKEKASQKKKMRRMRGSCLRNQKSKKIKTSLRGRENTISTIDKNFYKIQQKLKTKTTIMTKVTFCQNNINFQIYRMPTRRKRSLNSMLSAFKQELP